MRKPFRAGGVAVGALAVALSAGAFAFAPTSAALSTGTSLKVPASIRPGTPMKAVGAGASAAASAVTAATSLTNVKTVNWAGYAASFRTTTFRFVSTQFTVPALDCTGVTATDGAWAAHWIGLDGFRNTSATVEQIGVVEMCDGTTAQYAAFWEMFPNPANSPTSIHVSPGDKISMAVFYNRSIRKFTLTFSDTTTGQHFTRTRACPAGATCRRNSAEAISEAPALASTGDILPLADFANAHFNKVAITTTSGTHGALRSSAWATFKLTQVSDGTNPTITGDPISVGTVLDRPTSLVLKRTFIDQWQAANG